ncbi:unnamed protein product [Symbiodinium natans]|uniref:Uncharacterized protein n=1 Tax=Symbiodinium natans TaxID=878477 RepID=A0A812NAI5_9DINO|nr:unnamed protein product [Symbiodinium natans]
MVKSAFATVQEVDAAAFRLLRSDFTGVAAFSEGDRLTNAARDWAKAPSVEGLLQVRDVGLEEGPASKALESWKLPREVFAAARRLGCDMLPKPVNEDTCMDVSSNLQASDSTVPATRAAERSPPDIFSPLSELASSTHPAGGQGPNSKKRSLAQTLDFVAQGRAPKEYKAWTEDEEQRLLEGFRKYGKQWKMISKCCGLPHRNGTQVKDKWRVLNKNGLVPAWEDKEGQEEDEEDEAGSPAA